MNGKHSLSPGHLGFRQWRTGDYSWQRRRAADVLRKGGLVVHATEAVFGIAASIYAPAAAERMAKLKHRHGVKPFLVIVGEMQQVRELVSLKTQYINEIEESWPGPNTWIFPRLAGVPAWIGDEHGRLAIRLTGHPQARALALEAGPIFSTSANLKGRRPAKSLLQARTQLRDRVDIFLPGSLGNAARPSRIRDGLSGELIRK